MVSVYSSWAPLQGLRYSGMNRTLTMYLPGLSMLKVSDWSPPLVSLNLLNSVASLVAPTGVTLNMNFPRHGVPFDATSILALTLIFAPAFALCGPWAPALGWT